MKEGKRTEAMLSDIHIDNILQGGCMRKKQP